jgi:hypothetical protein
MLHYSCDLCKRPIDTRSEVRHVVKIEVFQALDECRCEEEDLDEADHLEEMQEMLERIEDGELVQDVDAFDDDAARLLRFDLCENCRNRFLKNPLGARSGKKLDFSNN